MIKEKTYIRVLWFCALMLPILLAAVFLHAEDVQAMGEAEHILIIDAGHGGEDGGAVAPDGTLESDLNLDIALRLEALARFWGIQTRMTRQTQEIDYPTSALTLAAKKKADQDARLSLIRDTPGAFLLSIHQNIYPAPSPHGIQVFFGREEGSQRLAEILQEALTSFLSPDNRRVAEEIDDGIYLMRNANCPAVLVECGFLSNPDELARLKTNDYHMELAAVMLSSYLQYQRGIDL